MNKVFINTLLQFQSLNPFSVSIFYPYCITTMAAPFLKNILWLPGIIPLKNPYAPCYSYMCLALSQLDLPKSELPAWAWFLSTSNGHTTQNATIAAVPLAKNCPTLVEKTLVWRRRESSIMKYEFISPKVRMYSTLNPVYPLDSFHVYPVYLLTFAYSNGHSTIALHVADVIAPKITLT